MNYGYITRKHISKISILPYFIKIAKDLHVFPMAILKNHYNIVK